MRERIVRLLGGLGLRVSAELVRAGPQEWLNVGSSSYELPRFVVQAVEAERARAAAAAQRGVEDLQRQADDAHAELAQVQADADRVHAALDRANARADEAERRAATHAVAAVEAERVAHAAREEAAGLRDVLADERERWARGEQFIAGAVAATTWQSTIKRA